MEKQEDENLASQKGSDLILLHFRLIPSLEGASEELEKEECRVAWPCLATNSEEIQVLFPIPGFHSPPSAPQTLTQLPSIDRFFQPETYLLSESCWFRPLTGVIWTLSLARGKAAWVMDERGARSQKQGQTSPQSGEVRGWKHPLIFGLLKPHL